MPGIESFPPPYGAAEAAQPPAYKAAMARDAVLARHVSAPDAAGACVVLQPGQHAALLNDLDKLVRQLAIKPDLDPALGYRTRIQLDEAICLLVVMREAMHACAKLEHDVSTNKLVEQLRQLKDVFNDFEAAELPGWMKLIDRMTEWVTGGGFEAAAAGPAEDSRADQVRLAADLDRQDAEDDSPLLNAAQRADVLTELRSISRQLAIASTEHEPDPVKGSINTAIRLHVVLEGSLKAAAVLGRPVSAEALKLAKFNLTHMCREFADEELSNSLQQLENMVQGVLDAGLDPAARRAFGLVEVPREAGPLDGVVGRGANQLD